MAPVNARCERMRAAVVTPRVSRPVCLDVLERRHGTRRSPSESATSPGRCARRVIDHRILSVSSSLLAENTSRHGASFCAQRIGFFEALQAVKGPQQNWWLIGVCFMVFAVEPQSSIVHFSIYHQGLIKSRPSE